MAAVTVPVSVDGAQAASPPALPEAAGALAAGKLAAGALAAPPPLQAATSSSTAGTAQSDILLDMWATSWLQARASSGGSADGYVDHGGVVS
jgi:hypothetical protein